MDDLNNKITIVRTEMNLAQDPQKRDELNKKLRVLQLRKEIEDIKKRIDMLSSR